MNTKNEIKLLKSRFDLMERTMNNHLFGNDQAADLRKAVAALGKFSTVKEGWGKSPLEVIIKHVESGQLDKIGFSPVEEFIDIEVPPDKPEIIGDYMHFKGENYYLLKEPDCTKCALKNEGQTICRSIKSCGGDSHWENIKEIDITDEIAVLRPWVRWGNNDGVFTLFAVNGVHALIGKMLNAIIYNNHLPNVENLYLATVSDLKKAGITE